MAIKVELKEPPPQHKIVSIEMTQEEAGLLKSIVGSINPFGEKDYSQLLHDMYRGLDCIKPTHNLKEMFVKLKQ